MTETRPTLEIIAPSVDEAIDKGLAQLGLSRDQVEINVLDTGNSGLFGLRSRQARIQIVILADQETNISSVTKNDSYTDVSDYGATDNLNQDQIVETTRGTIKELLEKMSIDAELEVYTGEAYGAENRTPVHVDILGKDLNILIGHRGETLNSLQYISRLMLGKELAHSVPLNIDVGGYRKRREEQIRQLARRMADQVIETQRSLSLEPMPANERRLAHLELQDDQDVYTESTGSGRFRKVVIYLQ